jgi:phosphoribosyl 1,2-cyclic phosphodiesterase
MMRFLVLASGSGGNATYLEIGQKKILIDAGISYRQIQSRAGQVGVSIKDIDDIFLTHEHGDHTSGLVTIQRRTGAKVHMTGGTYKNLSPRLRDNIDPNFVHLLEYQTPLILDGYGVTPFMTYHDALEPCGYRFMEQGKSLVYLTDTGYYPQKTFDAIRNADAYIIESNHEPSLLLDSDRPWLLKKRILDDQGHLSNDDSAYLIANVLGEKTKVIVLAHLSQECNTEADALRSYHEVFDREGLVMDQFQLVCARQDDPLALFEI